MPVRSLPVKCLLVNGLTDHGPVFSAHHFGARQFHRPAVPAQAVPAQALSTQALPDQPCSGLGVRRLLNSLQGNGVLLGGLVLGALAVSLATSPANAQTAFDPASLDQPSSPRWSTPADRAGAPTLAPPPSFNPLTGPRSRLQRDWVGLRRVSAATPILVLAGHADSQNIGGSGTAGEAVARYGAAAMYPGISDELYWNMVIAIQAVTLGQQRGLDIRYYRPPFRTIVNGNEVGTNWSVGRDHAAAGGYALEIHFDAYGPDGVGSGLIPPVHRPFSSIDESLAQEFGSYPMAFRDVLGGPKRGIGLLEIGKLEGRLEASLRDPRSRPQAVQAIAERIVRALEIGLGRQSTPTASNPAADNLGGNRTAADQGSRNRSTTNRTAQAR